MKKKSNIIRNVILVAALSVLIMVLFTAKDTGAIFKVLKTVKVQYLCIALIVTFIYWALWSFSLQVIVKYRFKDIKMIDNYLIAGSDLFFNGITPFSSGGQPFQLYSYSVIGMPASDGTSSLMMNFIVHQIVTNLLSVIFMIFYYGQVEAKVSSFMIVIIIGFAINIIVLLFLISVSMSKTARRLIEKFINLLSKIKFLHKLIEPRKEKIHNYLEDFQASFAEILRNKWILIKAILIRTLCLLTLYAIPILLLLSININITPDQYLLVMALSSFNFTFMVWIPLPGASGGAEYGFQQLLLAVPGVVSADIALTVMLLWRFMTYYLTMIYGFILYLIFERRRK